MPRSCSICQHKKGRHINHELVRGTAIRGISRRFRVSEDALSRHKTHVGKALARAGEREKEKRGLDIAAEAEKVRQRLWKIEAEMQNEGDNRGRVVAVRAVLDCIHTVSDLASRAGMIDLRKIPSRLLLDEVQRRGLRTEVETKIVVHHGDERQFQRQDLPEQATVDVLPQIVVHRVSAELPEPGPVEAQPQTRPALPPPPAPIQRVAPASGSAVRAPGPPIFDFSKPL